MTHIIREFHFINDFVFKADPADFAFGSFLLRKRELKKAT